VESEQGVSDHLLCPRHHGLVVAIGFVEFDGGELGIVSRGETFVAEDPACGWEERGMKTKR
jgi:hypothetical protein